MVRTFLTALLEAGHLVGFTSDLEAEWKDHAALFARRWLTVMRSRRRVARLLFETNVELRDRALATAGSENVYDAMAKDWHLLDAALATDRTISSSDDNARAYYAAAAIKVAALKPILWVNPATSNLKNWVDDGAQDDGEKRLG